MEEDNTDGTGSQVSTYSSEATVTSLLSSKSYSHALREQITDRTLRMINAMKTGYLLWHLESASRLGRLLEPLMTAVEKS